MSTVLAFDIGIKNLAYCVLQSADAEAEAEGSAGAGAGASATPLSVIALENCNLIEPSAEATRICSKCSSKATFLSSVSVSADPPSSAVARSGGAPGRSPRARSGTVPEAKVSAEVSSADTEAVTVATCKRHIPSTHTPLSTDEKVCSRIPAVAVLRSIARSAGLPAPSAAKRDALLSVLSTRFALPLTAPKAPRAADQGLEQIHDALRRFVAERWAVFRTCTAILLENQPAFKNPHMKSVQVLLFAVLRERFLQEQERGLGCGETTPLPTFHLVHAKKKVAGDGIAKGDAGYKARKDGSEKRLEELFATGAVAGADHLAAWTAAKKKSDMADALCMCVDFLAPGKKS
jgi:hypothetical protein